MDPEELRRLLAQHSGPIFNPSFLQVDRNTGEVSSTDPAVAEALRRERARNTPPAAPVQAPIAQGGTALDIPRDPPLQETPTLSLEPDVGHLGLEAREARRRARAADRPLAPGQAEAEAAAVLGERDRYNNPAPADDVPVLTEESLATTPTSPEPGSNYSTATEGGHPVYNLVDEQGVVHPLRYADQVSYAVSRGWLTQADAQRLGPTLPQRPSGGGGARLETQYDVTYQHPVSEATLQRAQGANDAVIRAQKGVDAGNVRQSGAVVGARQEVAGLLGQQAEQAAQEQQARTNAIQMRAARLDQAINNVASQRIDPEGYFGSGGEGFARRLGAVIAVALGSLGSSLSGGPNQALGIINAAIERNLASQRANQEHGRAMVGAQSQALNQMRDIYQDQAAAEQATRALQLQAAINRLDSNLAAMRPEQLMLAQDLRNRLLEQQAAARQMANERGAATLRLRATTREPVSPGTARAAATSFLQAEQPAATPAPQSQEDRALDELVPSTALGGRIRQGVERERARDRQRQPQRAAPPTQPTAPRVEEIPGSGGEVNTVDLNRQLNLQARGERGEGTVQQFVRLRPAENLRQRALATLADPQQRRAVGVVDDQAGRFIEAAQEYLRTKRRVNTAYLTDQTARGQMQAALYNLGAIMREMGNMGTAGSVGELQLVERLIPSDPNNWTGLLGEGYDRQLLQLDGVIRSMHSQLNARANRFGFELATVRQSATNAPERSE